MRGALRHRLPDAILHHAGFQPFTDQAQHAPVANPVLDEPHQPRVADVVEEPFDIGVQYPIHRPGLDARRERVQRIVLSPSRPEAIGEAEEVRLVDGIENLHHRTLDDLVLQRGDAERALPPVRLRDVGT